MPKITGTYTALVTPFDRHGHLDEENLQRNIHYQLANNIDGLILLGTTGESPTLTEPEKIRIIEIAKKNVQGRCHLMVGTGSYSTQQAIQNTKKAENLGADSVLVVTPYYNKPTQEGIIQHFRAIAEAVSLPIMIYNIPGRCGSNITPTSLRYLSEIPNIVGVKESAGSITQISEIIEMISRSNPHFSVMSGDDALTLPLISLGGHGVISVASNLIPQEVRTLVKHALRGDFDKAQDSHYQLSPLFRALFIETNPIPIKAAMNLCGFSTGGCRLPLSNLSTEHHEVLENVLTQMKLKTELLAGTHG